MNRKMTKNLSVIAAALAMTITSTPASAQMSACTQPAVTLKLMNFTDEAYNKLIRDYRELFYRSQTNVCGEDEKSCNRHKQRRE